MKTRRLRKKYEDDEEAEPEKKVHYTETNEEQDTEEKSESINSEKIATDRTPKAASFSEKLSNPNKLNDRLDDISIDKVKSIKSKDEGDDESSSVQEEADYETDEIIKKAIEDDDEDIEDMMSNDDL